MGKSKSRRRQKTRSGARLLARDPHLPISSERQSQEKDLSLFHLLRSNVTKDKEMGLSLLGNITLSWESLIRVLESEHVLDSILAYLADPVDSVSSQAFDTLIRTISVHGEPALDFWLSKGLLNLVVEVLQKASVGSIADVRVQAALEFLSVVFSTSSQPGYLLDSVPPLELVCSIVANVSCSISLRTTSACCLLVLSDVREEPLFSNHVDSLARICQNLETVSGAEYLFCAFVACSLFRPCLLGRQRGTILLADCISSFVAMSLGAQTVTAAAVISKTPEFKGLTACLQTLSDAIFVHGEPCRDVIEQMDYEIVLKALEVTFMPLTVLPCIELKLALVDVCEAAGAAAALVQNLTQIPGIFTSAQLSQVLRLLTATSTNTAGTYLSGFGGSVGVYRESLGSFLAAAFSAFHIVIRRLADENQMEALGKARDLIQRLAGDQRLAAVLRAPLIGSCSILLSRQVVSSEDVLLLAMAGISCELSESTAGLIIESLDCLFDRFSEPGVNALLLAHNAVDLVASRLRVIEAKMIASDENGGGLLGEMIDNGKRWIEYKRAQAF